MNTIKKMKKIVINIEMFKQVPFDYFLSYIKSSLL